MTIHKTILVIFGITGDLAQRKLIPALVHMSNAGHLQHTRIIGISRRDISVTQVLTASPEATQLANCLQVLTMDVEQLLEYQKLSASIATLKQELGADTQVIFYLSVPPHASLPIVEFLGQAGINDSSVKLLLEKPFGVDLASAQDAVAQIQNYYKEEQLYRIDHYLAKEMVQNIVAFRSQNAIFRNLWSREFIEKIDIVASEKIGIENRVGFYEQTGALRDFLQNHLMQLMALVIMDVPTDLNIKDIPAHRLKALQSIETLQPDSFGDYVKRGQYEGYIQEVGNLESTTETFVAVTLFSSDPKWHGVPIRLATGKNLAQQTTEIRIYFKQAHCAESNLLVLHIQPKEGIEIDLVAKKPGYDKAYDNVALSFNYRNQDNRPVEAYERVLLDALTSDKSLFTTASEVIASWQILQLVQERWAVSAEDLTMYQPGTAIEALF
ncbi:glucose-6-phosphate dehydrogenase (NADP(+)) [Pedobacter sp.]|nr:glucose-6-phosphate dehydrogenase (NADP(+)) [Candidatus Saccharibacteria bacterium]